MALCLCIMLYLVMEATCLCRHVHILKDPPILFLTKVPHDVYADPTEASAFMFWHLVCRMFPPGGK
jgi:hypothetical protein